MARLIRVATVMGVAARRRGGLAFGPEWLEVDPAAMLPDQLGAILTDPHLRFELQDQEEADESAVWRAPTEAEMDQIRRGFAAFQQFQAAQGGEGTAGGHMTVDGEGEPSPAPEPKIEEGKAASVVDPLGTSDSAALADAETREQTDGAPASAEAAPDGGNEPAKTVQSPVAAANRKPSGRKPRS